MKKEIILIAVMLAFLVLPMQVYAQGGVATASAFGLKEVKSLDIGIAYYSTVLANTNYSTNFTINETIFPDGFDYVVSVYGMWVIDRKTSNPQDFNFYINGGECVDSPLTVSLGQAQYVVVACFNDPLLMNLSFGDTANVTFSTDANTDNVLRRFFITYVNDPDFITSAFGSKLISDEIEMVSNHDYCVNDTTLTRDLTFEITLDNRTRNVSKSENITCQWDCDYNRNECIPDPAIRILWVIGIIIFIIFVIYIIKRFW